MNRLNLSTLNLIVLIADNGSMTEAAKKASLTVAAVSKRLLELESQLQIQLFERHGKGVALTEPGRAVLAQARQLLYDFDRLESQLTAFRTGGLGTVRMGANAASMTQFVPEDLARFFNKHPGVRVDLKELNTDEIVTRLTDGRLDLGLFAARETPLSVQAFPYRSYRLCVVTPQDSRLAKRSRIRFDEVASLPIIGLEGGSSLLQLLHRRASQALNIPVEARSFDVVCRFVQAGVGIGVVPEPLASVYAPAMNLSKLALLDEWAQRNIMIGTRSFDTLTPQARLLLAVLQNKKE